MNENEKLALMEEEELVEELMKPKRIRVLKTLDDNV